jgi:hypothetical protein
LSSHPAILFFFSENDGCLKNQENNMKVQRIKQANMSMRVLLAPVVAHLLIAHTDCEQLQ